MRGGESPFDLEGSSKESPSFPRRKHGLGDRNRRQWSAGRRLSPIARGKGTPRKRSGRFAPAQEASQASAFPGALLPIWGKQVRLRPGLHKQQGGRSVAYSVIPGRAEGANPESGGAPGICIWIPGSLAALAPRNDEGI